MLRSVLQAHRRELLGKAMFGLLQRGFAQMPIQLVIAISDGGEIKRQRGWRAPEEPFRTTVEKADNVPSFVREEIEHHERNSSLTKGDANDPYGAWLCKADEVERSARFLDSMHEPGPFDSREIEIVEEHEEQPKPVEHTRSVRINAECRSCGESVRLEGRSGRYGPYWHCLACETKTTMPRVCGVCGSNDASRVRVRKRGREFVRECDSCRVGEVVWRLPET